MSDRQDNLLRKVLGLREQIATDWLDMQQQKVEDSNPWKNRTWLAKKVDLSPSGISRRMRNPNHQDHIRNSVDESRYKYIEMAIALELSEEEINQGLVLAGYAAMPRNCGPLTNFEGYLERELALLQDVHRRLKQGQNLDWSMRWLVRE